MAKILLVDDRQESGETTRTALASEGHTVLWIQKDRVGPCQDELWEKLNDSTWDVLILDIQLGAEIYGGIWVYNHTVQAGYRERWTHTLVYSKHAGSAIRAATHPSHEFPIRVFVETAGIDFENVIMSNVGERKALLTRIAQLFK